MLCLIDGDILVYEIGFAAETGWKALHPDSPDPPPWDYVERLLNGRIEEILDKCQSKEKPEIYLTGKGNFREAIAKRKPYKGNRDDTKKPWHYKNIQAYLIGVLGAIKVEGMEADDAICIRQMEDYRAALAYCSGGEWGGTEPDYRDQLSTIICTRDKDLRQCPGFHYGWELGNQPQFGPQYVDPTGAIQLIKGELKGWGIKFFYAQCIVGDDTDNIPGLPGKGPAYAYRLLNDLQTIEDMETTVIASYRDYYGDLDWKKEFLEQAQLLWMVRELDAEGKPVMWKMLEE